MAFGQTVSEEECDNAVQKGSGLSVRPVRTSYRSTGPVTPVVEVCRSINMVVMRPLEGIRRRRAGQLATKPSPGHTPITFDRLGGDAQKLRGFLHGQATEVTELHDLCLPRVQLRQSFQGVVQFIPALTFRRMDGRDVFIQGHPLLFLAATLVALAPACIIHEDLPHQMGGNANESATILPIGLLLRDQAEVDFVNQRGGLQGVAATLLAKVVVCQLAQFIVNRCHEGIGSGTGLTQIREQTLTCGLGHVGSKQFYRITVECFPARSYDCRELG